MKIRIIGLFILLPVLVVTLYAQDLPAYRIFSSSGKAISFEKMAKDLSDEELVLFGELHDNAIAHWLQLELTKRLFQLNGTKLALGAEMFETHQNKYLQQYLVDGNDKAFRDSTKLWSNYGTDYKPLVDFARTNTLAFFASNVPRKYASMIFKKGPASLDSISAEERLLLCPLPFPFDSTLTQYQELIKMGMEMHASGINFAKAQAIKDATMAWNITLQLHAGKTVLHYNGSYHSDYHQSICWYVEQYRKGTRLKTISVVTQADLKKLSPEFFDKADYIIVVDEDVTRTLE
jgi:uncharacterized iron-regulated protein